MLRSSVQIFKALSTGTALYKFAFSLIAAMVIGVLAAFYFGAQNESSSFLIVGVFSIFITGLILLTLIIIRALQEEQKSD